MNTIKLVQYAKFGMRILSLMAILCFASCDMRYGFIESNFKLAPESRMPRWLNLQQQYARDNISINFTFYSHPVKDYVKCVVYGPAPEHQKLYEKVGTKRYFPDTENNRSAFPGYIIIKIDGIEEVFEHRERGNILYVTDDPKLTSVIKGN